MEEHPFWIDGQGWRKTSILEAGMKLLDKQGNATATVNTPLLTQHHHRIIKPPVCTGQVSYH